MTTYTHIPVLKEETIKFLNIRNGGVYVDCTAGRGGHIEGILQSGATGIKVLGIDKDPANIDFLKKKFADEKKLILVNSDYKFLVDIYNSII